MRVELSREEAKPSAIEREQDAPHGQKAHPNAGVATPRTAVRVEWDGFSFAIEGNGLGNDVGACAMLHAAHIAVSLQDVAIAFYLHDAVEHVVFFVHFCQHNVVKPRSSIGITAQKHFIARVLDHGAHAPPHGAKADRAPFFDEHTHMRNEGRVGYFYNMMLHVPISEERSWCRDSIRRLRGWANTLSHTKVCRPRCC